MICRLASKFVIAYLSIMVLNGQDNGINNDTTASGYFTSPIKHSILLAGSFGELRTNHFHSGIDIKSSNGEEGDTILASAKGYISRIKIQAGGYGRALYIDHPNGYTTVYAHLQVFADSIERYARQHQLEARSYEIDIYPENARFVLDQGDMIGIMGNTGRSYGPHLHFEIRETVTEMPINPYQYGLGPIDNKAPIINAIQVHGLDNNHLKIWSEEHVLKTPKGSPEPIKTFEIPAWRAGLAIQTYDLMDGASNKNGIYRLSMYVDDTLYYDHLMDSVSFGVTRYINSHIDYEVKSRDNRTLTKCYVSQGNRLTFYPVLVNNGEITIFKEKPKKIDIKVSDYKGNESIYSCYIKRRDRLEGEIPEVIFQKYLRQGQSHSFNLGSCRFYFPEGALDKDLYIDYSEDRPQDSLFSFKINDNTIPLFYQPVVSIPVCDVDSHLIDKIILVHEGKDSYGGTFDRDSLRVRIGALGSFEMFVDTFPPFLEVKSFLKEAKGLSSFRFEINDQYDPKGFARNVKYDVYIDGKWIIAPLKSLDNMLTIPLENIETGTHTIMIRLEDHSGNITKWQKEFIK